METFSAKSILIKSPTKHAVLSPTSDDVDSDTESVNLVADAQISQCTQWLQ